MEVVMFAVTSIVALICIVLAAVGYRIGFVWKHEEDVKQFSIPFSWLALLLVSGLVVAYFV